jgi:hypothetical protein
MLTHQENVQLEQIESKLSNALYVMSTALGTIRMITESGKFTIKHDRDALCRAMETFTKAAHDYEVWEQTLYGVERAMRLR